MAPTLPRAALALMLLAAPVGARRETPAGAARCAGISGVVRAGAGPIAGVDVAATGEPEPWSAPPTGTPAAARTRTDADGRYCLELRPGRYDVSATPRGTPAMAQLRAGAVVDSGRATVIDFALEDGGRPIRGMLRRDDGAIPGVGEVRAQRYESGETFHAGTGVDGDFALSLPRGTYRLFGHAGGWASASVDVVAGEATEPTLRLLPPVAHGPATEVVVAWLRAHAIPLASTDPDADDADLAALGGRLAAARLVGAGEASHGTREFFRFKHRLFRHLVRRHGFTTFALEAPFAEALDIDEFVRTGRGDPAAALAGVYAWTWQTEEVLELIRWMREWNADPAHEPKLRFRGFDMQSPVRAAILALARLQRVDTMRARQALRSLAPLTDPYTLDALRRGGARADFDALHAGATWLVATLDSQRPRWRRPSDVEEWRLTRQLARVVQQYTATLVADGDDYNLRDRAMAENLRWLVDEAGAQGRVFAWAHNDHVSREALRATERMGAHLAAALGSDYLSLGFAFARGAFVAVDGTAPTLPLRVFDVSPLGPGTLDDALRRVGRPLVAFDLRELPDTGEVGRWFSAPHGTYDIQAAFTSAMDGRFFQSFPVRDRFDVLVHVDSTTAARGLPHQVRGLSAPAGPPRHLDVSGDAADVLAAWGIASTRDPFGVHASVGPCAARVDRACLTMERAANEGYGERLGRAMQRIDATPYRGRRLVARLAAEWEARGRDRLGRPGVARLFLRMGAAPGGAPGAFARDVVLSPGRQEHVLELEVPAGARTIELGAALSGPGRLRLLGVSLHSIP